MRQVQVSLSSSGLYFMGSLDQTQSSLHSKISTESESTTSAGSEFHIFADLWTNANFLMFSRVCCLKIFKRFRPSSEVFFYSFSIFFSRRPGLGAQAPLNYVSHAITFAWAIFGVMRIFARLHRKKCEKMCSGH